MGFKKNIDNARLVTPERAESIMNECIEIKERFGLDRFSIYKISKFYLYNITIRVGTVQDTLKYLVDTLKALGKDEDDIRYYLIKNGSVYLADVADFKARLSILNRCGLLEDTLLNHSNILTHATSTRILSTQFLYSICKSKEFKVDMNEINILKDMSLEKKKELLNKYRLTAEELFTLNYTLRKSINQLRKENTENSLKLK